LAGNNTAFFLLLKDKNTSKNHQSKRLPGSGGNLPRAPSRGLIVKHLREFGGFPILIECALHEFPLAFWRQPADRRVAVEFGRERVSLSARRNCCSSFGATHAPQRAALE
jgi:hypothetical protein